MDLAQQQQQFSFAFVKAVASVVGANTLEAAVDEDSLDVAFSVHRGFDFGEGIRPTWRAPQLHAQLKTCRCQDLMHDDGVHYPLKVKNYNDLCGDPELAPVLVPRILILVQLPDDLSDWLVVRPDELALRHCAWWLSLCGSRPSTNETTVTVTFPKTQAFGPVALRRLLATVAEGTPL